MNENTKKDGSAALPHAERVGDIATQHGGMTLRDYFSAKAMQGAISSSSDKLDFGHDIGAAWAYQVADAMLAARDKGGAA